MWWLEVKGEGKGEEGNGDRDKGERDLSTGLSPIQFAWQKMNSPLD
jgi:hypothetical protein